MSNEVKRIDRSMIQEGKFIDHGTCLNAEFRFLAFLSLLYLEGREAETKQYTTKNGIAIALPKVAIEVGGETIRFSALNEVIISAPQDPELAGLLLMKAGHNTYLGRPLNEWNLSRNLVHQRLATERDPFYSSSSTSHLIRINSAAQKIGFPDENDWENLYKSLLATVRWK